jgi:hypothetical protein
MSAAHPIDEATKPSTSKRRRLRTSLLMLCAILCAAGSAAGRTAEIERVHVARSGENLKIEVTLTEKVSPKVVIAENPDRLVLELPDTWSDARQQHIAVNMAGVKDLRIGLTSSRPMMTRLVVDLEGGSRPYGLSSSGNTIALMVLPAGGPASVRDVNRASESESGGSEAASAVTKGNRKKRVQLGFKVKYVAEGAVYLGGGRHAGLEAGMTLTVTERKAGWSRTVQSADSSTAVAELRVISVAENSAVTDVSAAKRAVRPGDWAYLSLEETELVMARKARGEEPRIPTPTFSDRTSTQSEAMLARTPRFEKSEAGRVRARIGFDYSSIRGSIGSSTAMGVVARADITRIAGTHWNLQGYWRGRMTTHSRTEEESLQSVLNKMYTMQLYYENPGSKWVAGVGRGYVPWANSLDTLDGGYFGRRVANKVIVGLFAGTNPDPASFQYNPDRRMAGSFVNVSSGDSEGIRYTSTTGIALNWLKWKLDRPFVFTENGVSYRNRVWVYHTLMADAPQGTSSDGITPGAGITRSYLTVHVQAHPRLSFDINHNYFRDVPTAETALIGTGLVDKLLYEGLSVGVRAEPIKNVQVYTTLGQSDKTGDVRRTLNQMYGLTLVEIGRTGLRADAHYSKFDSSFGKGDYSLLTLSRHVGDHMMWDMQVGEQRVASSFTANTISRFVDTSMDMNLFLGTFLQSGYTLVRGDAANYNQWYLSLGYRFDSKGTGR